MISVGGDLSALFSDRVTYSVSEEEVSSPLYLCIIRSPTHTADVLVSVHCVVVSKQCW